MSEQTPQTPAAPVTAGPFTFPPATGPGTPPPAAAVPPVVAPVPLPQPDVTPSAPVDFDSPEAQAAVRAYIAAQSQAATGADVAGIYGDVAGASQHAPDQTPEEIAAGLAAKGAKPAAADPDALMAMIERMAAELADLKAKTLPAEPEPVEPLKLTQIVAGKVSAPVAHAFDYLEERVRALENHVGLREADPEPESDGTS